MSSDDVVIVQGLSKRYALGLTGSTASVRDAVRRVRHPWAKRARDEFCALDDVSFRLPAGEILGVIGRNGAGKSTLLKILSRVTDPSDGSVDIYGRLGSLLEVGTGFHPEMTGRENVYLNGAILGLDRRSVRARFDQIVEFSGVGPFLDTPVKRYSSGMYVRLAFAVAAHLDTDVLVIDEVLAVGDAEFQERCLGRMKELSGGGRTVIFVSHNMSSITRLCTRALLLDRGRVVLDASPAEVVAKYMGGDARQRAEATWTDEGSRPGDDAARLLRVAVVDEADRPIGEVSIDTGCRVLVEYEVRAVPGRSAPVPHLGFYDASGTLLFLSLSPPLDLRGPGHVLTRCVVPPDLLNEGPVTVHAGLATLTPAIDHVQEPDVVAFTATDPQGRSKTRRGYQKSYPGAVRPLLDWRSD